MSCGQGRVFGEAKQSTCWAIVRPTWILIQIQLEGFRKKDRILTCSFHFYLFILIHLPRILFPLWRIFTALKNAERGRAHYPSI